MFLVETMCGSWIIQIHDESEVLTTLFYFYFNIHICVIVYVHRYVDVFN